MRKIFKRFLLLWLTIGTVAFVCAGCQTTHGFGEDVENLGQEIQGD